MPHDVYGEELQPGDEVTIRFRVKGVSPGEKDCNVSLETIDVAATGQSYLPAISCNSKLVEKVPSFMQGGF